MPQPSQKTAARPQVSREELFLARYAELRGWAQRLTSGDRARAEDLVQDAYVHFTAARPDLSRVENLDGYLYAMLRNLNTSQLRRAARLRDRALPVVEYESAVVAARAADPRDLVRVQDELRACCRYACARKGTSKAGSVLALRFFHGYYPREIAAVSLTTREGVEERLRTARAEARQFLRDPAGLRFMRGSGAGQVRFAREGFAQTTETLLADLRRALFDAREGACPPAGRLAGLYAQKSPAPLDTRLLAHVVSCEACLEEVNRLQGLAPLSERFPVDVAGAEARTKGGDGGGGGDEGGGGGDDDAGGALSGGLGGGDFEDGPGERELLSLRVRARELFEHRPRELCVAVNGRVLAAQKTGAARCEQTLSVPGDEGVEFVEILSEQEVRLLLLDVNEYRALADGELTASIALSDERRLEARLTLDGAWPRVRVVYEEPPLAAAAREATREAAAGEGVFAGASSRAAAWLSRVAGRFRNSGFWLRPATLAAGLSVLVVAALLLTRVSVPTASAAELLARSAAAEDRLAADARLVMHRTYVVEETGTGTGAQAERLRVEVWQSAARGVKLRRAYDRAGRLVAGEWELSDGTRTVYDTRAGGGAAAAEPAALVASGELWRLDLSPRVFSSLIGDASRAEVEDALGSYVLNYRAEGAGVEGALAAATLRLAKSDLRATGQTLAVVRGGARREYRFVESAFERVPNERVEPRVFEPEAELLAKGSTVTTAANRSAQGASPALESLPPGVVAPAVASPELEVEVAYLLSRIRADLGEQVSLTRTTGGQLRVEALAETAGRKEEILRALGPVLRNPAVLVDVSTVEERLARERARAAGASEGAEVEVSAGAAPADEELRRYFAARVTGERAVEEEVRKLGARAMSHSRAALLHASALRTMAARFTPTQASALAPEARAKWLAMLDEHARAVRREVRALNGELRPVFSPGSAGANAGAVEADPRAAAERLYALTSSTDEAVRSAFNSTAGGAAQTPALRSRQFWRALQAADSLAASIPAAYEK